MDGKLRQAGHQAAEQRPHRRLVQRLEVQRQERPLTGAPAGPAPASEAAAVPQTIDFTALIKQAKGTFDAEEMPDDS